MLAQVLQFRLLNEYNVDIRLRPLSFQHARRGWTARATTRTNSSAQEYTKVLVDRDNHPIVLFRNDWASLTAWSVP
ncbi:MAG: hypothetical protein R3E66_11530 [bacterium]